MGVLAMFWQLLEIVISVQTDNIKPLACASHVRYVYLLYESIGMHILASQNDRIKH